MAYFLIIVEAPSSNKKTQDIKGNGSSSGSYLDLRKSDGAKETRLFSSWPKNIFFLSIPLFVLLLSIKGLVFAPINSGISTAQVVLTSQTDSNGNSKEELEKQLAQIEKEIENYQANILKARKNARSLKGEISILDNKISKLNLQIRAIQLTSRRINQEIALQEKEINLKEIQIAREKEILAATLQNLYEKENQSLLEITLKNSSLSDFFNDINSIISVQEGVRMSLKKLKALKAELEQRREELLDKKIQTLRLANIQVLQKKSLAREQHEKGKLLKTTKMRESIYKKLLSKSQQTAAQIRSRIYELMGIGKPITFGDALKIAEFASKVTGVRKALILAVITQESKLGENVGTCNRRGDPPQKSWRSVMKPNRDQSIFVSIVNKLNSAGYHLDISNLPVSCPMRSRSGSYIGWGGAMGPAQFLPSTWVIYENQVAKITGHNPPSPWNVQDAFVASALLLRDNGAGNHSWKSEWRAAMRYFAGSVNWRYRFYGDSVMSLAEKYQRDIDQLGSN